MPKTRSEITKKLQALKQKTERGEEKAEWTKHLSTNVRAYYKRSLSWLAKNKFQVTMAKPIG